jgi:hypothetical protein
MQQREVIHRPRISFDIFTPDSAALIMVEGR